MIYIFLLTCLTLTVLVPSETILSLGVSNTHLVGALTYPFAHTSIIHLVLNAICILLMYNPIHKIYESRFGHVPGWRFFLILFLASVLAAFPAAVDTPTIGASGIVYAMLGMLIVLRPTMRQLKGYIYVLLAFAIQIYFGKSNIALHACAFITGALFIIIKEAIDSIRIHREE